jgi:phosphatidylglycerophosphate synthase
LGAVDRAVVTTGPGSETAVAGLPLAVRAVLALSEAGFSTVSVLAHGRPPWAAEPLARRGIAVRWGGEPSVEPADFSAIGNGLVLVLAGDVLLDAAAGSAVRKASAGPVRNGEGRLVGVVCRPPDVPQYLGRPHLWACAPGRGAQLMTGLAVPLDPAKGVRGLERVLLEHLADRPTGDSYLATLIDRPLSRPVTRLLLRTSLTPSHVTLVGMACGLLGAAGLATVSYWGRLVGVALLVMSIVLDCVDGDMARAKLEQGAAGARLDVTGDYLVHLAALAGLAIGLLREGLPAHGVWAALALIAGVGAAMITVHVLFIRPALERGGDLHWAGDAGSLRGRPGTVLVEKLASRDYTYLLLALAAIGHLEWFLYAAAAGAWVFTTALIAYWLQVTARAHRGAHPR